MRVAGGDFQQHTAPQTYSVSRILSFSCAMPWYDPSRCYPSRFADITDLPCVFWFAETIFGKCLQLSAFSSPSSGEAGHPHGTPGPPVQRWSLTVILLTAAATRCELHPTPMDVTGCAQPLHPQPGSLDSDTYTAQLYKLPSSTAESTLRVELHFKKVISVIFFPAAVNISEYFFYESAVSSKTVCPPFLCHKEV